MPLFSVIIPTFNRLPLLKQTLSSIFEQSMVDYEIIVVDDGSTDGTVEYLHSLGGKLRVLTQSNRGPGSARNLGVQYAAGDFLAFLDSDDLWFPWTLKTYHQLLWTSGESSFIAGKPRRFRDMHELAGANEGPVEVRYFRDYLASGNEWRWWGVSSFVIQRDAFTAAGGFSEESINGEDADLVLRLGIAPGFAQVLSPDTFAYREHAASVMNDVSRNVNGAWVQIRSERAGEYPGGAIRGPERRRILTRHLRPASLECLRNSRQQDGWALYWATFGWNFMQGRWRYLIGFPLKAWFSYLKS